MPTIIYIESGGSCEAKKEGAPVCPQGHSGGDTLVIFIVALAPFLGSL
jgi:hypothetical protein